MTSSIGNIANSSPRTHHRNIVAEFPPEIRSQIYDYLSSADHLAFAHAGRRNRNDPELWAHIAKPLSNVPVNAMAMWDARKAEQTRKMRRETLVGNTQLLEKASLEWLMVTAVNAAVGMYAGLFVVELAPERSDSKKDIQPMLFGLGVGVAAGFVWGATLYAGEFFTRRRALKALSKPTAIAAAPNFTNGSPHETQKWMQEMSPLQSYIKSLFLCFRLDTSHGSDLAFLINDLRLPIPLQEAFNIGRPSIVMRSIKKATYVTADELKAFLHDIRSISQPWHTIALRMMLEKTSSDVFKSIFFSPTVWLKRTYLEPMAPTLDMLLTKLCPEERKTLINDVNCAAMDGNSLFHAVADNGNVAAFKVLKAHGGDLDARDTFSNSTVRQIAMRRRNLRQEPGLLE